MLSSYRLVNELRPRKGSSIQPPSDVRMLQLRQLINSVVQRLREQEADEPQQAEHEHDAATPRQGLPQLLSEEDARTAQREAVDLWGVMHDEDLRRERLFRLENASACVRQTPVKRFPPIAAGRKPPSKLGRCAKDLQSELLA